MGMFDFCHMTWYLHQRKKNQSQHALSIACFMSSLVSLTGEI